MTRRRRRILAVVVLLGLAGWAYVRTHPLDFIPTHRHCITYAGMQFTNYASEHGGQYPTHPKGYGNALLLLGDDSYSFETLTGPGYDPQAFQDAKQAGTGLDEKDCGRVYVQGLTTKSSTEVAILFDKLPTPGGDHCHLPGRLWAPLGREVLFVGSTHQFVSEREWPEFAKTQIDLLVKEGIAREEAERLYVAKAE